jgi:hypothetical protein
MNKNILKIPYVAVREDWNLLQQFLKIKGNPRYIIVGDVDLHSRQDISDLGNLVGVEGDLWLNRSSVESLGELEFVDGELNLIKCSNIKTLGKLKKVDGDLRLGKSSIQVLGNLKKVDGNLWLNNSSIESLSNLEEVGRFFSLYNCKNIKTLGKLKRVGFSLDLGLSSIESLGELEYVGKNLVLNVNIPPSELDNVEVVGTINR